MMRGVKTTAGSNPVASADMFFMDTKLEEILSEIHPNKNSGFKIQSITPGSHKKIWWQCDKGHEWEAAIYSRALLGSKCPYCSNKQVLTGFNDLKTLHPELAEFYSTQNSIPAEEISKSSHKKTLWECKFNHVWELSPSNMIKRNKNSYCILCSKPPVKPQSQTRSEVKNKATKTIESFTSISEELKFKENVKYSIHSSKIVAWKCSNGHEWEAQIRTRFKFNKTTFVKTLPCPVCSIKIANTVDKQEWFSPEIWSTNNPAANTITMGSARRLEWLGSCGHIWERTIQSYIKKSSCPICENKQLLTGFNDLKTYNPSFLKEWHPTKNGNLTPEAVLFNSGKNIWWVCEKNHEWKAQPYNRFYLDYKCFECTNGYRTSKPEKQIVDFLVQENVKVITNSRTVISPFELDVYIPEKNIAIEYNGLYWHTEKKGKSKTYYYDKWLACKEQGIQLIQVWEDDWKHNPELVKRMILHKLGINQDFKVYARASVVKVISTDVAKTFLEMNHIQGNVLATHKLGLFHKNELVSVMLFQKTSDPSRYSLVRYATSCNVPGGFTKLLSYAEKTVPLMKTVETFSDNCLSTGALYEYNGFTVEKTLLPDYKYLYKGKRYHKFLFRKKRFKEDAELTYKATLTERELADLNGVSRIWDAGKIKWVKSC